MRDRTKIPDKEVTKIAKQLLKDGCTADYVKSILGDMVNDRRISTLAYNKAIAIIK